MFFSFVLLKVTEALPLTLALFASFYGSFGLGFVCVRRFGLFAGLKNAACIGAIVSTLIGGYIAAQTAISLSFAGVDLMAAACLCFSVLCLVTGFLIGVASSEPRIERKYSEG